MQNFKVGNRLLPAVVSNLFCFDVIKVVYSFVAANRVRHLITNQSYTKLVI